MKISIHETESAVAPRRSQVARREQSDRRMLRAATRLIAKRGVSGTSLADVGIEAGYSRGLPVERFGSKFGLVKTLLESMDEWFQIHLAKALKGKSGIEALKLRIDAHLGSTSRSAAATAALYSIYMESLLVMPELKPSVAAFTERWRQGLSHHLREGQAQGEVRKDIDCDAQAVLLLATMRGLVIHHLMDEAVTDLAKLKVILLSMVDETLAARPPIRAKLR
jgi:AcrR family transcriptional regulator